MRELTTTQALVVAHDKGYPVSRVTLINWAKKGIGKKVGGRWYLDDDLLIELLAGGKHDGANKTEIKSATDSTANNATENRGGG
jgi:hypothetical protein